QFLQHVCAQKIINDQRLFRVQGRFFGHQLGGRRSMHFIEPRIQSHGRKPPRSGGDWDATVDAILSTLAPAGKPRLTGLSAIIGSPQSSWVCSDKNCAFGVVLSWKVNDPKICCTVSLELSLSSFRTSAISPIAGNGAIVQHGHNASAHHLVLYGRPWWI